MKLDYVTDRLEYSEVRQNPFDNPLRINKPNISLWVDLGISKPVALWIDYRGWWRPKSWPVTDGPSVNDLATHRWRVRAFDDPEVELAALRGVQDGHPLAFRNLLARFHGKILQIASGHMPKHWRRRSRHQDKHVNHLLFEDLVAAGVMGLWEGAQGFDVDAGFRFWSKARSRVLGAVSDEARHWRRQGPAETRMERWLYVKVPPKQTRIWSHLGPKSKPRRRRSCERGRKEYARVER